MKILNVWNFLDSLLVWGWPSPSPGLSQNSKRPFVVLCGGAASRKPSRNLLPSCFPVKRFEIWIVWNWSWPVADEKSTLGYRNGLAVDF